MKTYKYVVYFCKEKTPPFTSRGFVVVHTHSTNEAAILATAQRIKDGLFTTIESIERDGTPVVQSDRFNNFEVRLLGVPV